MTSEWGLGSWGLDPWGGDPSIDLDSAVPTSTHSVLVTTSRAMRQESALSAGDALNPATWTVSDLTSGAVYDILRIELVTDRRIVLHVRTPWRGWNYYHRVRSTTLRASTGILISAPYNADFRGVVQATAAGQPSGPFDLLSTDVYGGSLRTTEAGAYAQVYGEDLIRQMIYRRLTTMPGSYFHIAESEFGVGLRIKEPLRISAISALKRQIEDEILKEPGVQAAQVALSLASGVLSMDLKVQTSDGEIETRIATV